jgi:flagellar protein FliL
VAKIAAAPAPAKAPDAAPPKKKRTKLFLIVGLVFMLLGAGGAAAWYFTRPAPEENGEAEAKPAGKPVFVNIDPFTVNLASEGGDHYLQVGIVYQVTDDKVGDNLKVHMPILRNRLLMLLSSKQPSDIATADGKKKLVNELIVAARESIPANDKEKDKDKEKADKGVTAALLSSFVIQ